MPSARFVAAVLVGVVGLAWLFSPPVPEGRILWSVTKGHGLTVGDLPGLAALAAAGWLAAGALRRGVRRSRR